MFCIENPPGIVAGSSTMSPATCMYELGVSMYRKVASRPLRRCMAEVSTPVGDSATRGTGGTPRRPCARSQDDLLPQAGRVTRAVTEPDDCPFVQAPSGDRERVRIEHVVERGAGMRLGDALDGVGIRRR